jgi:hypothetical protein
VVAALALCKRLDRSSGCAHVRGDFAPGTIDGTLVRARRFDPDERLDDREDVIEVVSSGFEKGGHREKSGSPDV